MKKLSEAQKRALNKLTKNWKSLYELQESISTCNKLIDFGLAEQTVLPGSLFFPRTCTLYRLKGK